MKVLLLSLGTRGDIEPFLALAEKFSERNDTVTCAFPIQFKSLTEKLNFRFLGLSEKFLELIEGEKAKILIGGKGNIFQKLNALIWMIRTSQSMQKEVMQQQYDLITAEQPDLIIYNQKCLYPMVWGMKFSGKTTMLSPLPCTVHEYDGHAALGMGSDHGKFLNRLTYRFSNFFLFMTVKSSTKKFRKKLSLKLRQGRVKRHILQEEKMIYTVSPSLFERPPSWTSNVQIVGYRKRREESDWKPDEELRQFFGKHEKILFITFGSMTNPEPETKTREIADVLERHQIPAIINTASGGLMKLSDPSEYIIFTEKIPYSYIFTKIYAVVHHGGSGTTHTAIRYGCASMIIPHILDQHVWNDIISQKGLGPKGFPIRKFTANRFEEKLLDLWNNQDYKVKSKQTAALMEKEELEIGMMEFVLNKAKSSKEFNVN